MQNQVFEPFQKVLVRLQEGEVWKCAFYDRKGVGSYHIVIGPAYDPTEGNILPYNDETKHLLDTKNDPAPKWEPKPGELVTVYNEPEHKVARVFMEMNDGKYSCKYGGWDPRGRDKNADWEHCEPLRDHFNIPD